MNRSIDFWIVYRVSVPSYMNLVMSIHQKLCLICFAASPVALIASKRHSELFELCMYYSI